MTDRLEALQELVRQYRQAPDAYVAYMICRDLGLLRRARSAALAEGAAIPGIEEEEISAAEALLDERPSVVEEALSMVDGDEMLRRFRQYVRTRPAGDDTDEGLSLLYTYDCLNQLVAVAAGDEGKLAEAVRSRVAGLGNALRAMASVVEEHVQAFGAFAPMVNQYCLEWDVEEANPLSRVAEFESPEIAELVTADRARVAVVPPATPDCLTENVLVEIAERIVPITSEVERHLAACLRCPELLDNAINTYVRTPLTFWERLARLKGRLTGAGVWVFNAGGELVGRATEQLGRDAEGLVLQLREIFEVQEPQAVPVVTRLASFRDILAAAVEVEIPIRARLLDSMGRAAGECPATVRVAPAVRTGTFTMVVEFEDDRFAGTETWVTVQGAEGVRAVCACRIAGRRLAVREDLSTVLGELSGQMPISNVEVAVMLPVPGTAGESVEDHLAWSQVLGYAFERLQADEGRQIRLHLERCLRCSGIKRWIDRIATAGGAIAASLETVGWSLSPVRIPVPVAAFATSEREPLTFRTQLLDLELAVAIRAREDGTLMLWLETRNTSLSGAAVRVALVAPDGREGWERTLVLHQGPPGWYEAHLQVGTSSMLAGDWYVGANVVVPTVLTPDDIPGLRASAREGLERDHLARSAWRAWLEQALSRSGLNRAVNRELQSLLDEIRRDFEVTDG